MVRARIIGGYKDSGLYRTMRECEDVKSKLRKVTDPDVARRKKLRQIKLRGIIIDDATNGDVHNTRGGGYLGMSPAELQGVRKVLKQVDGGDRSCGVGGGG